MAASTTYLTPDEAERTMFPYYASMRERETRAASDKLLRSGDNDQDIEVLLCEWQTSKTRRA
jgi:hypothetical protein